MWAYSEAKSLDGSDRGGVCCALRSLFFPIPLDPLLETLLAEKQRKSLAS
jgi:hypothetical protein